MGLIFNEYYHGQTGLTVGVERLLFSERSPYQKVEVFQTDTWGRMLVIDGMVMLSEKDEFVYHEMLTHVPLFTNSNPERVLIIGGGDGGTAREVLRHSAVQTVELVEIDEMVVRAAKKFLPEVGGWHNSKLEIHYEDGLQFIRGVEEKYDVILIDGSDPTGPAQILFENEFLNACYSALTEVGVLAAQIESPWVKKYHPVIRRYFATLNDTFPVSKMYLASIPLYPAGLWAFALASKKEDPVNSKTLERVRKGLNEFGPALKYYNAEMHKGCFALPNFVANIIKR